MAVRLGHVAGVEVRVHVSVVLVFGIVTWGLATATLPLVAEDASPAARWTAAVAGGLLFFAALLAHETAHAVVARRHGIAVRSLTLWLLGGVAELEGSAGSPGVEARVAAAGPLTSIGIGAVAGGAGALLAVLGAPDVVTAVAWWLAMVNGVLAAFNLLPAFPMDGGRLLRAGLWRRWGDRERATRAAAGAGRAFGTMLVAFGLVEVLYGSAAGLWLVLIGWFVTAAGRAETLVGETEAHLRGLTVRDVMTTDVVLVPSWCTVEEFAERFAARQRYPAFPVVDIDGSPVGIVTLEAAVSVPAAARASVPIGRVAIPLARLAVVRPDEPVADVLPRLARAPVAVVVDEGRFAGLLGAVDVAYAERLAALGAPSARAATYATSSSSVPTAP